MTDVLQANLNDFCEPHLEYLLLLETHIRPFIKCMDLSSTFI